MSNISNTMVITDSSLAQVSRELIDKRVYKEELVTTIGNPVIYNGIASNFSATNNVFASFDPVTPKNKIVLKAKGTYSSTLNAASGSQVLTKVIGANSSPSIEYKLDGRISAVRFHNNSNSNNRSAEILLTLHDGDEIEVEVIATSENVTINAIVNNKYYTNTWNGNGLYCGTLSDWQATFTGNWYWTGSIDLVACALYVDDKLIFTPSAKNSFNFNKIMIADSTNPLTDASTPVLNHVYECPVTEISHTENNVLLTTTIPEDAYLNITQLGLYYTDDNGTHIFSTIDGLSIKKTSDLVYNLVIHIKLDINVVNTVAVPEILIKEKPRTNFSEFLSVKQIYAYITENMERMIKLNALGKGSYTNGIMSESKPVGVGYNKAQIYYRLQSALALWKDNFVTTNNYAKVKAKFTPYTTEYFNSTNITKVGDIYLDEKTGILSILSENNYAYTQSFPLSTNNDWKLTVNFTTSNNVITKQSIITFSSNSIGQPLTLGIENNKCTLKIEGNDGSSIISNTSRFIVHGLKKYKVIIEYMNNIYHVSYKVDNSEHTNIYSFASIKPLNVTNRTLFGVGYTGSVTESPFLGIIDLYNTNLVTSMYSNGTIITNIYNFLSETTYSKSLLDYFHLPVYTHSYFLVNNLGFDENSYLEEYEGAFKGHNDKIYFNNPKGFTLCTKVDLFNENDKVLLAKGNVDTNQYYFIFEQKDNAIIFTLYLNEDTVVLKKDFTIQNIRNFIEHPINITITCNGNQYSPTFKMYKNNELLDTYTLPINSTKNVSDMYLMNHEAITPDEDLEVHTVYDIICFEGELSPEEIYYMNNILDTNF